MGNHLPPWHHGKSFPTTPTIELTLSIWPYPCFPETCMSEDNSSKFYPSQLLTNIHQLQHWLGCSMEDYLNPAHHNLAPVSNI